MISFVIPCAIFATACLAALQLDEYRRRRRVREGDTWEGSTVRRHRDTGEHHHVPAPTMVAAAAIIERARAARTIAEPWPGRQTRMSHDDIRNMPLSTPRRYVGRVEVVFPDVVAATPIRRDWADHLRRAAEWQDAMRADRPLRELVSA